MILDLNQQVFGQNFIPHLEICHLDTVVRYLEQKKDIKYVLYIYEKYYTQNQETLVEGNQQVYIIITVSGTERVIRAIFLDLISR